MVFERKYVYLLFIGLLLYTGVMCFDHLIKENPQDSLSHSFSKIEQLYIQDSLSLIVDYLENGQLSEELEQAPFAIEVYDKNDSLLYWNETFAKKDSGYKTHWQRKFEYKDRAVVFTLDLFNENTLDLGVILSRTDLPQYAYVFDKSGKIELPIKGNSIHLSVVSSNITSEWHDYMVMIWLFSIVLVGISLLYFHKTLSSYYKNLRSWSWYMLAIVVFFGVSAKLATPYIFGAHPLVETMANPVAISLMDFILLGVFVFFFAEGLAIGSIKNRWLRIPVIARYSVGSLVSNMLLFSALFLGERFILGGDVPINIEEVLNLNTKAYILIFALVAYCFLYYLLTSILYKYNDKGKIAHRMIAHAMGLICVALVFVGLGMQSSIVVLVFFVVAYFLLHDVFEDFNVRNIVYVLFNAILFSGVLSYIIFYSALRKDKEERKQRIEKVFTFLSESDKANVIAIRDSLIKSDLTPSIASLHFPSPSESLTYPAPMDRKELLHYIRSIIQDADSTKLFDLIGVECYDQLGNSLFFNYVSNYKKNNELIQNSSRVDDKIYHLPIGSVTSIFFQINNEELSYGPINLIIKLKKKNSVSDLELEGKNYLIYKNNDLIYSFSKDFIDINNIEPSTLDVDIEVGDMSYVVYSPGGNYKIIDYHKVAGNIKLSTFFSLIFILSIIWLVFLVTLNSRVKFLSDEFSFALFTQSSLSTKIQLTVITLFIISFLIIGMTTTVYFKDIVQNNDRSKFKTELKTIINDVQNKLTETIDTESAYNVMSKEFSTLENVYSRRFAFYNEEGDLLIHSDNYENVFRRIPFKVLKSFSQFPSRSLKLVSQELDNNQVLIPIYLTKSSPLGYLSMNYESEKNINSGIFNHLGILLNLYVFFFFLAGALSIMIANSITKPLAELREGVKRFKLGRKNEPLKYQSNDELGVLIKEYNSMTKQLEHSANIIAKTERDMAWREMAKQVAHEIKNPLTPMKLHIQHLKNMSSSSPERAQEMIGKVSSTLIEQINNLSSIASEFSNFATLPKADNNRTELNEVVEHVHDLFRERDDMDIFMNEPIDDLIVFADRNHLVRIFVNIIKNAIQSIPQGKRGRIEIELSKEINTAQVRIADNGVGIPESMKDKIFTPNFTTKSSGTGLGLAICVNMLDTMNGKIYFTSEENVGTQFFIEIPIMRNTNENKSEDIYYE